MGHFQNNQFQVNVRYSNYQILVASKEEAEEAVLNFLLAVIRKKKDLNLGLL